MDEEPRIGLSSWAWFSYLLATVAVLVTAWLLSSCATSMLERARLDCLREGGLFLARPDSALMPDGNVYPAIVMICVYKGKAA